VKNPQQTRKKPAPPENKKLLRMQELVKATGVPKSTILHYLAEGLLPEPVKTSRNMAYYDPQCIERLEFIKTLQGRYRLPLAKIKNLLELKDQGRDLSLRMELAEVVFGPADPAPLDEEAFCQATGLTPAQLRALQDNQLILPLNPGQFDREDVGMGRLYTQGLALGLKVEDLSFYPELGRRIVDQEMALRRRLTHHLPEDMDALITIRLTQAARATRSYVIDRLFQLRAAAARDLKE